LSPLNKIPGGSYAATPGNSMAHVLGGGGGSTIETSRVP